MDAAEQLNLAVIGDLHLEPASLGQWEGAREQLRAALCDEDGRPLANARVVQLGDLGAYAAKPGSRACFAVASSFLAGFAPLPFSLVTGNHDLEGFDDFASDAENLAAWRETFGQHHFWAVRAGGHLLVGLSTTRFRDAPGSCHEVFIDDAQLAWFAATLAANRDVPTLVFSHAPPAGSGLRTLPAVHVKNRCAWLNHGQENRLVFSELAATNPQVSGPRSLLRSLAAARVVDMCRPAHSPLSSQLKLWFSGHFHLSQDYADSLNVCGECTFVQVGVIGSSASRDGRSHSRLLRADAQGFSLFTVDHNRGGALRLDMARSYVPVGDACPLVWPAAQNQALTSWPGSEWMLSLDSCKLGGSGSRSDWLYTGNGELTVQDGALVEYCSLSRSPLGVVVKKVQPGWRVRLVGAGGEVAEGVSAVAVEVRGEDGALLERVARGPSGRFHQVFQQNKYKKWLAQKAEAAETTAAV